MEKDFSRENTFANFPSNLCWKHFAEEDIVKGKMIGQEFVHQERWRLKKGAKPTLLLDTATRRRNIHQPLTPLSTNQVVKKEHYSRSKNILLPFWVFHVENHPLLSNNNTTQCSSNPIDVSLPLDSANISIMSEIVSQDINLDQNVKDYYSVIQEDLDRSTDPTLPSPHTIEVNGHSTGDVSFYEQVNLAEASVGCNGADSAIDELAFQSLQKNVKLPSNSWNWNYNGKTAVCMTWLDADDGNVVIKTLRLLSTTRLSFHLWGKVISLPNAKGTYRDYDELSGFIKTLDRRNVCKGIANSLVVNVTGKFTISRDGDVSRSSRCSSLSNENSELCTACSKALRYIRKRSAIKKNSVISKRKLAVKNKKIGRMKSREVVFASELKLTQNKCRALTANLRDNSFEAVMNKLNEQERQVVMTYVKHAAAKPGNNGFKCGMRYEPGFLIECLLLRMKSSKAYHHLRANKILPLPGPNTLRRLISSSDCGFGLNPACIGEYSKCAKQI